MILIKNEKNIAFISIRFSTIEFVFRKLSFYYIVDAIYLFIHFFWHSLNEEKRLALPWHPP